MRRFLRLSIVLVFLAVPLLAWAQPPKRVGIGIILGQPTGVSAKFWLSRTSAFDVAGAWQFGTTGQLTVQADYLYHIYHLFPIKKGQLPLYFGIGGSATVQSSPTVDIRVPVGVEYLLPDAPLGIFLEVGVGLQVYPGTKFVPSGGIGIRYLF